MMAILHPHLPSFLHGTAVTGLDEQAEGSIPNLDSSDKAGFAPFNYTHAGNLALAGHASITRTDARRGTT